MSGFDLMTLQDKIKPVNRDKKRLQSQNNRNSSSIVRKKAQIEKLLGEISMLEEEIVINEGQIEEKTFQAEVTEEIITSNRLVEKQAELDRLSKDLASLKSIEKRLCQTIGNNGDQKEEATNELIQLEEKIAGLNQELARLNPTAAIDQVPAILTNHSSADSQFEKTELS